MSADAIAWQAIINGYMTVDAPVSASEAEGAVNYYGFINAQGSWYIMRETITAGIAHYDFARGQGTGYSTAWTNKATQDYEEFHGFY